MSIQSMMDVDLSNAESVLMLKLDMKTKEGIETINKLFNSGINSLTVMLTVSEVTKYLTFSDTQNSGANHKIELDPDKPRICRTELTSRENQILGQIALGLSNKRIGRKLDICEGTVKVHVKNLLRKLGANTRYEAAILYLNTRRPAQVA